MGCVVTLGSFFPSLYLVNTAGAYLARHFAHSAYRLQPFRQLRRHMHMCGSTGLNHRVQTPLFVIHRLLSLLWKTSCLTTTIIHGFMGAYLKSFQNNLASQFVRVPVNQSLLQVRLHRHWLRHILCIARCPILCYE